MQMTAWYMKKDWFREGILGAKPDPKNLSATHVEVRHAWVSDGDESDVESLLQFFYVSMQAEKWSPNGEASDLIRGLGLAHSSMSVGDVIVAEGVAHLVTTLGFEALGSVS